MNEQRMQEQGTSDMEGGLRDLLKRELEGEIRQAIEAELREELSLELRERVVARLKTELAEEIQVRIARVKAELEAEILARAAPAPAPREFERFSWNFRAQHLVLMASCLILIITGLPLKFHEARVSQLFFDLVGGVQVSTLIHRIGAVGLICVGIYHALYLLLFREGRRNFLELLPRPKDALDLLRMLRYFLGRTDEKPRFGRFSYVEKFDYWAVYWGIVIMIGSGLILWFLETSLQFLPKFAADIAREAHSDEGLLATLAIIIWHFYNVHLNPEHFPMNRTFWTGMISEEEMRRHHPLEYEEFLASRAARPPAPAAAPATRVAAATPPIPPLEKVLGVPGNESS
ncbi:MAG TPA: cytochrome b/b6 domain-containing protein [Candidatus Methylomirabilis sp.]|nr:cytochrome b/b6 domain-containing protein [Candidatus Methylomirabilis sp.]HSC70565.1 cytochrome b/b6 domain-containing protein [Candidatus Methylomirabilis sp.]